MKEPAPLLSIRNVSVDYRLAGNRVLRAVKGASFDVGQGEIFGIIGESGSGKSSLGRAIVGLARSTEGEILHDGQDVSQLDREAFQTYQRDFGFIYQDANAALNPRMTIGLSVREPLDIQGKLSTAQKNQLVREELERVGLGPEYTTRYPHELSGGQKQRVNIARALIVKPRLLVCDEVVAALDVSIQADVLNLFLSLQRDLNLAYVFISHDLRVVAHVSDRVAVMYLGKIVETGDSATLLRQPMHPYTKALMSAEPRIDITGDRTAERIILKGEIPSPIDPPTGCPFRTRCWLATDICATVEPILQGRGDGRSVACHALPQLQV
jgi:peptide/nickel transport system ATP-binding protein/oligopeptide transport system ATP-binding protein